MAREYAGRRRRGAVFAWERFVLPAACLKPSMSMSVASSEKGRTPSARILSLAGLDDPRGNLLPGPQRLCRGALMNENRLAAAQEVAREKRLPGHDLAHLVKAHDRRSQGLLIGSDLGTLLPATPLEIVVDGIASVLEFLRERILEGAAPKGHLPVIPEDLAEILEVEIGFAQNGSEMRVHHLLEVLTPVVAAHELHESEKIMGGFHVRSSSGGVRRRSWIRWAG